MDFKINIKCGSCLCGFSLRPNSYKPSGTIACPNCGQQLPAEISEKLSIGLDALGSVPERLPENADCFSKYDFKIEVVRYNVFLTDKD